MHQSNGYSVARATQLPLSNCIGFKSIQFQMTCSSFFFLERNLIKSRTTIRIARLLVQFLFFFSLKKVVRVQHRRVQTITEFSSSNRKRSNFCVVCRNWANLRYCSHFYSIQSTTATTSNEITSWQFCASFRKHAFAIKYNRHVLAQNYESQRRKNMETEPFLQHLWFNRIPLIRLITWNIIRWLCDCHS